MFDAVVELLAGFVSSEHVWAVVGQVVTGISIVVPALRWLAQQTKTTADDAVVDTIDDWLNKIPRLKR